MSVPIAGDNVNRAEARRSGLDVHSHTSAEEFHAFDRLPKEIRDILNDSPIRFTATQAYQAIRDHGFTVGRLERAYERSIAKWRRNDRYDMEHGLGVYAVGGGGE